MTTYPHIFTPEKDTLEARVQAYKEVLSAYRNAQLSLDNKEDSALMPTLGSKEEIEMIQKNGLLDKTELQETIRLKRQNEMKSSRQNKSSDQHSLNRQK